MKYATTIAGALLGLAFLAFGLNHFLKFIPEPKETPPAEVISFMTALTPTGYLGMVKVLEVLGGLLIALPRTRNLGLLVLGPIIVNIFAFHVFLNGGIKEPVTPVIGLLALFLLWAERKAWAGLLAR